MNELPFLPDSGTVFGRRPVLLPDPILAGDGKPARLAYVKPVEGRDRLHSGTSPLYRRMIEELPEIEDDEDPRLDEMLSAARDLVLQTLCCPKAVVGDPGPGECCISDVSEANIWVLYYASVKITTSLYYGLDETMGGKLDEELRAHQWDATKFFARCIHELNETYDSMARADDEKLRTLWLFLKALDQMRGEK